MQQNWVYKISFFITSPFLIFILTIRFIFRFITGAKTRNIFLIIYSSVDSPSHWAILVPNESGHHPDGLNAGPSKVIHVVEDVENGFKLLFKRNYEPRPSIRLALSSALTRKETEKAVTVLRNILIKVLGKRRYNFYLFFCCWTRHSIILQNAHILNVHEGIPLNKEGEQFFLFKAWLIVRDVYVFPA
jgi:hypothetical protein